MKNIRFSNEMQYQLQWIGQAELRCVTWGTAGDAGLMRVFFSHSLCFAYWFIDFKQFADKRQYV